MPKQFVFINYHTLWAFCILGLFSVSLSAKHTSLVVFEVEMDPPIVIYVTTPTLCSNGLLQCVDMYKIHLVSTEQISADSGRDTEPMRSIPA